MSLLEIFLLRMKPLHFHAKHPLVTPLPDPVSGTVEISRLADALAARLHASAARAIAARPDIEAAAIAKVFFADFEKKMEISTPLKPQGEMPSKFGKKRKIG